MTRTFLTIVLICTFLVALPECAASGSSVAEDTAVLSAIVADRCQYAATHPDKNKYQVLSAQASVIDSVPNKKDLDAGAAESLALRNKTTHDLPALTLCPAFKLVPLVKIEAALSKKGWPGFYKAFPNASGISYLSLPGYSADGTVAIVEVSGACDELCGSGFYWVMLKVEGKWTVQRSISAWIS